MCPPPGLDTVDTLTTSERPGCQDHRRHSLDTLDTSTPVSTDTPSTLPRHSVDTVDTVDTSTHQGSNATTSQGALERAGLGHFGSIFDLFSSGISADLLARRRPLHGYDRAARARQGIAKSRRLHAPRPSLYPKCSPGIVPSRD